MTGLKLLAVLALSVAYISCADIECPEESNEVPFLIAGEDCSHFYMCDHKKPVPMECPEGLHFSADLQRCDYPEIAQCDLESEVPEDADPRCVNGVGIEQIILPIPGNCTHFEMCDFYHAVVVPCAAGTEFNHKTKECDHPEDAECVEGESGVEE